MSDCFILLAAGKGKRFKSKNLKQFHILNGKPLIYHSIEKAIKSKIFKEIIVVTNSKIKKPNKKSIKLIKGGSERFKSSKKALEYIKKKKFKNVFIHDAARPNFSIQLLKKLKKGYGFDSFEGLPEDWHNQKAGTYSSDNKVPKIDGGEFIVGKFENTLPKFFAGKRPKACIVNFDADLYSSTICALNHAKSVIDGHTILIFDEFVINKNWEQDEYRALEEFCNTNHYNYEVLAISFFTKQVAVKIVGI